MIPISSSISSTAAASCHSRTSGKGLDHGEKGPLARQLAPDLLGDKGGDRVHQFEHLLQHLSSTPRACSLASGHRLPNRSALIHSRYQSQNSRQMNW
jgi:hypothetical protein